MDTIILNLTGWVGNDAFSADYIDYMLDKKYKGAPVKVIISSFGGYTNDSLRICSAFRRHGDVTVLYTGMNASAATIAGMGARHIMMESSAFWMVHNASSLIDIWSRMNAEELEHHIEEIRSEIDTLRTLDEGVAALYAARCSKTPAELSALMSEERWMTAAEALEWGFVDEIVDTTGKKLPQSVVMAVSEAGLPDIPGYRSSSLTERIRSAIADIFGGRRAVEENSAEVINPKNTAMDNPTSPATSVAEEQSAPVAPATSAAHSAPDAETQNSDPDVPEVESAEDLQARIASLEAQLAERDQRIASLESAPGAETAQVHSSKKEPKAVSCVDQFASDMQMARQLFRNI
ncbi:MAG: ATP-dependent Clp protease proteolytic subunit [Muribaculaceae bacterium]|nr:ATP-dependent Clp protease proteolytic subunit [Muribaculaceae bacterium]